jgi:cell division protein FtsQ
LSTRTLERPSRAEVDPRIAARRDAVTADRRRRRHRWLAWVAVVITVAAGGWLLTRSALLDVEQVRVEGATHTSVDDVVAASGVSTGDPLVGLDEGAAVRGVEALPWIAEATVERSIDGTVRVRVTERVAVATVPTEAGRALVDLDGRVLAAVGSDEEVAEPDTVLMAIEGLVAPGPGGMLGPEAAGAMEVLAGLTPGLQARVSSVAITPDGGLALALRPQGVAELGPPTELPAKLASLVTVLAQVDQTGLGTINLRVPDLPTVSDRVA